jgi:hypothetical protein
VTRLRVVVLALGALGALGGCAKKRIPECDAFVKTIEKVGTCSKIPDAQRSTILESAKTIRDSLQMIDEAGGVADAPADLVGSMRDACKTQDASIKQMYADCLK